MILTGGPLLRRVANAAGARVLVGAARHQVAVTDRHDAFAGARLPMMFDLRAGIYWRQEEGGLLWGMSNPHETPGPARTIDRTYLGHDGAAPEPAGPGDEGARARRRCGRPRSSTRPTTCPILGPLVTRDGAEVDGVTLACACGHGMMWGPAVSRIAADLSLTGTTDLVDASIYRMDRFDAEGRSPFYDPIALPFPVTADED